MRWLGVILDRTLSFRKHVETWTVKARKVAGLLRHLCNTRHGPPPAMVRQAMIACIQPVLMFGAEVWFPGTEITNEKMETKSTRVGYLVDRIQEVLVIAMRAILPVWRTTPNAALYRESGILPADQMLEAVRMRAALRMQSLDHFHPLAKRSEGEILGQHGGRSRKPVTTRLIRTGKLLYRAPRPPLMERIPPQAENPLQTASKEDTAKAFLAWLESVPKEDLVVYSDGSLSDNAEAGYGFTVHRGGKDISGGAGRLGDAEVFDAEARGALEGLRRAVSIAGEGTYISASTILPLRPASVARLPPPHRRYSSPSDKSPNTTGELTFAGAPGTKTFLGMSSRTPTPNMDRHFQYHLGASLHWLG